LATITLLAASLKPLDKKLMSLQRYTCERSSPNVIKALKFAKIRHFYNRFSPPPNSGKMKDICGFALCAASKISARVQECHVLLIHIIAKISSIKNTKTKTEHFGNSAVSKMLYLINHQ